MPLTTDEKLLALSRETIAVFDKAHGRAHFQGSARARSRASWLTGDAICDRQPGSRLADAGRRHPAF